MFVTFLLYSRSYSILIGLIFKALVFHDFPGVGIHGCWPEGPLPSRHSRYHPRDVGLGTRSENHFQFEANCTQQPSPPIFFIKGFLRVPPRHIPRKRLGQEGLLQNQKGRRGGFTSGKIKLQHSRDLTCRRLRSLNPVTSLARCRPFLWILTSLNPEPAVFLLHQI